MKQIVTPRSQAGALMIEILITIAIVIIGAMGLMQMQGRLHKSEMESYQRTQAMILLNDMASRIESNRLRAAGYVSTVDNPFMGGTEDELDCATLDVSTLEERDLAEWCFALQGASEAQAGSSVGAMVGGRGCIQPYGDSQYMVTVVWQGLTPVSVPPGNITCGANMYDTAGTACAEDEFLDQCRRYVTTLVSLAKLDT